MRAKKANKKWISSFSLGDIFCVYDFMKDDSRDESYEKYGVRIKFD